MSDTTPRDQLAQIIEDHYYDGRSGWISYENRQKAIERMANKILAAGFRPPARVVTTVEELDALPEGTVIRDREGTVAESWDGVWHSSEGGCYGHEILALPATVLYEPEEDE